jgi:hypothetical protein
MSQLGASSFKDGRALGSSRQLRIMPDKKADTGQVARVLSVSVSVFGDFAPIGIGVSTRPECRGFLLSHSFCGETPERGSGPVFLKLVEGGLPSH